MSKREVPKLNRDNFPTWKSLMRLHLGGIGDHTQTSMIVEHVDLVGVPIAEDMKKKKEHNQAMLEIAFALSYVEFDDIKGCNTTYKMWKILQAIYGGDKNVQRAKSESLRGNFDDMRMEEGENIAQYIARIKEVASAIRGATGQIEDDTSLRKVL